MLAMDPTEEGVRVGEEDIAAMKVGAEQAELHDDAHDDSRCGGCKPRFDCVSSIRCMCWLIWWREAQINGSRA
jgi:hypothetical protein